MRFLGLSLLVAYVVCSNAYTISRGVEDQGMGFTTPISDMVRGYGYPFQEHQVVTPDGYLITIHRIPHGRQQTGIRRTPVFLQHGLLSSSDSWLMNQPGISLPYLLADAGFDVWMGNVRGNTYGRRHQTLNPQQPEFWNFSWDDIARHDIPSMLNYIIRTTDVPTETFGQQDFTGVRDTDILNKILSRQNVGDVQSLIGKNIMNPRSKLHYIGHSEGTLLGFVQFGRDKDLASKIGVFVALSPIGTIGSSVSPIANFLRNQDLSNIFTQPEVMSNSQFTNFLKQYICQTPELTELCANLVAYKTPSSLRTGTQTVPFLLSRFPAGTSSKNLIHYGQLARSGNLQAFDYGTPERNQFYYKQNIPTQYSLKDVNVPVVAFYGNQDLLVGDKDFQNLIQSLPNVVYQNLVDQYGHYDFVTSRDAKERVYNKLIQLLLSQQI